MCVCAPSSTKSCEEVDYSFLAQILVFVDIFVDSPKLDEVLNALSSLPNVLELYEVSGEFDIVSLVSAKDIEEFRSILKGQILKIQGIKSTVSSVVFFAHNGPFATKSPD